MWPQQQAQYSNNAFNNGNVPLQPSVQSGHVNSPNGAHQQQAEKTLGIIVEYKT
jgi:hypothetical protein